MTDETVVSEPKRRFPTKLTLLGIGGAVLLATVGGIGVIVVKRDVVRKASCTRLGLFCVKATTTATETKPVGCPGDRMTGALDAERTSETAWTLTADVTGQVELRRGETGATGHSSVACYSGRFLANFTDMSNGVTYQCMGTLADTHYDGVCVKSEGASTLIAGTFVD